MTEFEMRMKAAQKAVGLGKLSRRDFMSFAIASGLSIPAAIMVAPGVNGYSEASDKPPAVDVEGAKKFPTIHGLVNAAGLTDRGNIFDTTVELWDLL